MTWLLFITTNLNRVRLEDDLHQDLRVDRLQRVFGELFERVEFHLRRICGSIRGILLLEKDLPLFAGNCSSGTL